MKTPSNELKARERRHRRRSSEPRRAGSAEGPSRPGRGVAAEGAPGQGERAARAHRASGVEGKELISAQCEEPSPKSLSRAEKLELGHSEYVNGIGRREKWVIGLGWAGL